MFDIKLAGENAIIIYFGDKIAEDLIEKIAFYSESLKQGLAELIIDAIPSYTSVLVSYRLDLINHDDFCDLVTKVLENTASTGLVIQGKAIEIPVFYSTSVGLDLSRLLVEKQISLEQFIAIHSSQIYRIYAIGFSPNFAFLGQVDQAIAMTRKATPRLQIPAGSVGIADTQTAVYPTVSSGGWNIIARTPIDLSFANPNLPRFSVGDSVRFVPISEQDYVALGGKL